MKNSHTAVLIAAGLIVLNVAAEPGACQSDTSKGKSSPALPGGAPATARNKLPGGPDAGLTKTDDSAARDNGGFGGGSPFGPGGKFAGQTNPPGGIVTGPGIPRHITETPALNSVNPQAQLGNNSPSAVGGANILPGVVRPVFPGVTGGGIPLNRQLPGGAGPDSSIKGGAGFRVPILNRPVVSPNLPATGGGVRTPVTGTPKPPIRGVTLPVKIPTRVPTNGNSQQRVIIPAKIR